MVTEQRKRQLWVETAIIFAAWAVFAILLAHQSYVQMGLGGRRIRVRWDVALQPALIDATFWAFSTVAIFWLARRFPLERGGVLRAIAVHVVGALVVALARTGLMIGVGLNVPWRSFSFFFWATSSENVIFYALLLGIAHIVIYYRRYREREQAAEQLARGLMEARLQALKMQLQPHFLFNTLNAISALIPPEAQPARRMVARLGDLLRTSLEHEETQEVTLREELAFLQPYLDIEQARLEDRLTVVMNIAPATLDARVPHLILQPLVENAVRHGIASRMGPGRVEISASGGSQDGFLRLQIKDDGRGMDPHAESGRRRGVGLTNIRSRLEQLYGGDHRFTIENHGDGGVLVQIALPFRRAPQTEKAAR